MLNIPWWFYVFVAITGIISWRTTKKWTNTILICYMVLFLAQTVLFRETSEEAHYKLTIFWSYNVFKKEHLNWNNIMFIKQIFLNIMIFIPIGFLCGIELKIKGAVIGIGFSILIELLQLITHRGYFELDDIFHNLLGTVIGVLLAIGIKWIQKHIQSCKKQG